MVTSGKYEEPYKDIMRVDVVFSYLALLPVAVTVVVSICASVQMNQRGQKDFVSKQGEVQKVKQALISPNGRSIRERDGASEPI